MPKYLRPSISNGNAVEQALIRRWWLRDKGGHGRMVWEYKLEERWADGILFLNDKAHALEEPGINTSMRFPLKGTEVIICEAKAALTPELVGQALVYSYLAVRAGAVVRETVVFAEEGTPAMKEAAAHLGLTVQVESLDE